MHNIHDQIPERILFVGDWHGSLYQAETAIQYAHTHGVTHIVQVGDFGIWRADTHYLDKSNELLLKHNIFLYFIDGNHENFPRLYAYPIQETGTREIRSNIHHLPRGFRFTWDTVRFLAMGGAYSVDKDMRTTGKDHWDEELITREDIDRAGTEKTDVLLSHDSPRDAPNPITDNLLSHQRGVQWFGAHNIAKATVHRRTLQEVSDNTDPIIIIHGHYHAYMAQEYTRPATGTRCFVHSLDQGGQGHNKIALHAPLYTLDLLKDIRKDLTEKGTN